MVLSDKSGLKGGWYWGEPFDFLTEQEQRDYNDAPYEFEDRTAAQNDAVYLYNRAKKYIDTKDWSSQGIDAKIQEKRRKRAQRLYKEEEMHPFDFMTKQEKSDYDEAPYRSEDRDPTPEQANAVRLHQRINEAIAECSDWNEVTARVQQHRREIYGDQGSEEGTSPNHEQDARSDTSSNHEQYARSDTSSNHEQYARSDTSSNHEQYARSDTSSNHDQYARSDTSSNHEQYARSDTSSNHEQDARSDTSSNHEQDEYEFPSPLSGDHPYFSERYPATPIHGKSVYRSSIRNGCTVDATMMLLHDQGIYDVSEQELAAALKFDQHIGTYMSNMPNALEMFGSISYEYKYPSDIDNLKQALNTGYSATSSVGPDEIGVFHTLVVDNIGEDSHGYGPFVYIRDSLAYDPYKVTVDAWKEAWAYRDVLPS